MAVKSAIEKLRTVEWHDMTGQVQTNYQIFARFGKQSGGFNLQDKFTTAH